MGLSAAVSVNRLIRSLVMMDIDYKHCERESKRLYGLRDIHLDLVIFRPPFKKRSRPGAIDDPIAYR